MTAVGLRELRQNAHELVRRAQAGEEINITVAGRLAARLVPAETPRWQQFADISGLFNGPSDPQWDNDRQLISQKVDDPWERA